MSSKQRPNSFNPEAVKPCQASPGPKLAPRNQPPQLVHNRYARGGRRFLVKEWAFKIQHKGQLRVFSLRGKTKPEAALEARSIWDIIVADGWEAALGHHADQARRGELFSRELTVGFAWCANPVLWTYATIHTLVNPSRHSSPSPAADAQRVLILESDAGIRRALEWCVDQQAGLCSVTCESEKSFEKEFATHQPALVLLNRNMAARIGWEWQGQVAPFRNGVPALAYCCSADAGGLLTSQVADAKGCLFMGVKPEHLLEPIALQAGRPGLSADDILARVRALYKVLLQPRTGRDTSALATLTPRERHVLALVSEGRVDKEIAAALLISVWTVHGHIKSIFARLRVRTRTEAAVRYLEE